ncbi:MAG: methyltransferase domain-containing protein [Candidatus Nitrosocosmicus sp.]|nr:methyltransferase domain-containing protein [Candidatus Nitrosocosmicus sp.]
MESNTGTNAIPHNETVINRFTKQAKEFFHKSHNSNQYGLNLMLKLSNPGKEDTVLDVACGPGIIACEYAKLVNHVTGIDLTPSLIERAKHVQKEQGLNNIEWRVGDVSNLPFSDESFSIVMTRASFHHIVDRKRVLEEMIRVCKIGGKILVVEVTPDNDKKEAFNHVEKLREPSYTNAWTLEELTKTMKDLGAVNIGSERFDLEMDLEKNLTSLVPNLKTKTKLSTFQTRS